MAFLRRSSFARRSLRLFCWLILPIYFIALISQTTLNLPSSLLSLRGGAIDSGNSAATPVSPTFSTSIVPMYPARSSFRTSYTAGPVRPVLNATNWKEGRLDLRWFAWQLGPSTSLEVALAPAKIAWRPRWLSSTVFTLPLWPLALASVITLFATAKRAIPRDHCAACRYDLRGIAQSAGAARCPECGRLNRGKRRILPAATRVSFLLRWGGPALIATLLALYPLSFWRQSVIGYERLLSVWVADGVLGVNLRGSDYTLFWALKNHAWLKPKYPLWHWRTGQSAAQFPIWSVMALVTLPTVWAWRRHNRLRREEAPDAPLRKTEPRAQARDEVAAPA